MSKKEKQPTCLGNCADCTCESLKLELHPATFREGFMYQTRAICKRDIAALGPGYTAIDEVLCHKRIPPYMTRLHGIAILDETPPRYLFPNYIAEAYAINWAFPDIPVMVFETAAALIQKGLGLEVSEKTCEEVFSKEEMQLAYRIVYDDPNAPRSYFVPNSVIGINEVADRIKGEALPEDINYPWLPRERALMKGLIEVLNGRDSSAAIYLRIIECGYSALCTDILRTSIQTSVTNALLNPTKPVESNHEIFGRLYTVLQALKLKEEASVNVPKETPEVVEAAPCEVCL